ncbi:unnamed protein product, partial [Effrenium voratum]
GSALAIFRIPMANSGASRGHPEGTVLCRVGPFRDMPEDVVEVSVRKTFVHVDLAAAASTRRPTRRHASAPAAGGWRIPPPADAPRASTDPYAQTSVTMQENLEERSISDKVDSKFDSDSDRDMFVYHAWSLSSREAEAKDSAESSCLLPGEAARSCSAATVASSSGQECNPGTQMRTDMARLHREGRCL